MVTELVNRDFELVLGRYDAGDEGRGATRIIRVVENQAAAGRAYDLTGAGAAGPGSPARRGGSAAGRRARRCDARRRRRVGSKCEPCGRRNRPAPAQERRRATFAPRQPRVQARRAGARWAERTKRILIVNFIERLGKGRIAGVLTVDLEIVVAVTVECELRGLQEVDHQTLPLFRQVEFARQEP